MAKDLSRRAYRTQRWAARAALAAAALAVVVPLAYDGIGGVLLLVAAAVGLAVTAAAVWWTLTLRGPARAAAAVLAVAVPGVVVVLFAATFFWALPLSLALWAVAVWSGRYALRGTGDHRIRVMRERRTPPPRRPFLIMNPSSGGGKVTRFGLTDKAERLGARVVLLDPESPRTSPPWPVPPSRTARTYWGSPGATAPRRWSRPSPPSTTSPSW